MKKYESCYYCRFYDPFLWHKSDEKRGYCTFCEQHVCARCAYESVCEQYGAVRQQIFDALHHTCAMFEENI